MSSATRARAAHLGPARRKPQVLDAAQSVALRHGLGAVTINAIAKELGVTRPVVYACYPDRVALIEALVDRESAVLLDSVLAALHDTDPQAAPQEAFEHGFRALLHAAHRHADAWRLVLAGQPDEAVSTRFLEARDHVKRSATAWIAPAMTRWWGTQDLDRKLPILIDLFMAACESAVRVLVAGDDWTADELGTYLGSSLVKVFEAA